VSAYSQAFQPNAPASEQALLSLVAGVPALLPDGHLAFLRRANGGEGPKPFFIGTDGGGEAYAFNISASNPTVFEVPFIGLPSDARMIARSIPSLTGEVEDV
jgi:hypothetical protein